MGAANYRERAEEAERMAARLPPGFERDDLIRHAAAFRDIAELLAVQTARESLREREVNRRKTHTK